MELIAAIDLRRGQVVRLRQGDDRQRTVYEVDPVATLLGYAGAGAARVHVVDLDAALGHSPQRELIRRLVAAAGAPRVQLGGGLRDRTAVEWAFEAGCERVVLTSLMVRDFPLFAELTETYPGRIVPALDLRDGQLKLSGWTEAAAESVADVCARLRPLPVAAVLVTDIERDGTMQGPNLEITRRIAHQCQAPGLVSGGVRSLEDLEAACQVPEIAGAIVGRALYEGAFTLAEALTACGQREAS